MDSEEMIFEKLKVVVASINPAISVNELQKTDRLDDFIDSIGMMFFFDQLEKTFSIRIYPSDIHRAKFETFGDACKFIGILKFDKST